MKVTTTKINGLYIIEPDVFGDSRGYFMETYTKSKYESAGIICDFIQDNESMSSYGVIRGLHYQLAPYTQSKLVRVISGTVLDIAVDMRAGSPTLGQYVAVELSGENKRQFYVPKGFAHGFAVLSEGAVFAYKCDNYYSPSHERGVRFDDKSIGIDWRIPENERNISAKDMKLGNFDKAELL